MHDIKDKASLIIALRNDEPMKSKPKGSPLMALLGKDHGEEDPDLDRKGAESAVKRFFDSGNAGDWKGAAKALHDASQLCDAYADDESVYDDDVSSLPSLDDDSKASDSE